MMAVLKRWRGQVTGVAASEPRRFRPILPGLLGALPGGELDGDADDA